MQKAISLESKIIVLICLADMFLTLAAVLGGVAVEANPIMAYCIRHSIWAFVLVKTASFLPFVLATEYYRSHKPLFVRTASRAAIFLYLFVYATLMLHINAT